MILDSSAVVAILLSEPGHELLENEIAAAPAPTMGAPTLAETGIVLARKAGPLGRTLLRDFLLVSGVETVPFTEQHAEVALEAHHRYGKGRHPAGLNFGDCMTYAVAKFAGEPLLALGDDFAHTDLELA